MKILIIGNSFLPLPSVEGGAIETLVDEYLKYSVNNNNYEITVYSPYSKKVNFEENKNYSNCEFRYVNKGGMLYRFIKYFMAIKRRIFINKTLPTTYCKCVIHDLTKRKERNKYDLVIVENEKESLITYKKYINSIIVEHLHNDYINIETKNAKEIVDSCDEFWCVSKFIANRIEEISNSGKTKVLYNGIDTKEFSKKISIEENEKLKKILNIKNDDYVVLFVGRIMPEKGVLELVKAFNIAKKNNNKLKLIIVGGKKNDGNEINNYMYQLNKESDKNKESIIFYGKADVESLIKLHNISNVQVIPSMWNEAFGLIAVEGICANHPLIVSNSGGLVEVVDNKSAIIVNRENIVNEIADAILKISTDKKLSNTLVNNANKVKEKFDYKEYNKRFDELIKNITNE